MRAVVSLSVLTLIPVTISAQRPVTNRPAVLDITAAIVLGDMIVRPLPQFGFQVAATPDSTRVVDVRTDLMGHATQELPSGSYILTSRESATINGRRYSWRVPLTLASGQTLKLELTGLNATVESVAVARNLAPEMELYQRMRSGVVRVEAGGGHGSGWLIDTVPGLVVTNHHVIAGAKYIAVQLDSVTKVPGQLLADDPKRDLAIVRIAQDACRSCYRFRRATTNSDGPLVAVGERVVAFGYPLNQETVVTMTLGIVSSLREKAIISDVNINHGNSGGPMVNLDGAVVGVNTFGDFTDQGGPGISGAVLVSELDSVLTRGLDTMSAVPEPAARHLPIMPLVAYPADKLALFAQDDPKLRRRYTNINGGDFTIDIVTPPSRYVRRAQMEREVSRERRQREEKAGVSSEQRYRSGDEPEWAQYLGENQAVVIVLVSPKVGETGGSQWLRALSVAATGTDAQAKFVFKSDLEDLTLYRDTVPVEPIARYRFPQEVLVNNATVRMADVAYSLAYLYSVDAFAPGGAEASTQITLGVVDIKHVDRGEKSILLDDALVTQVWADFAPWREVLQTRH